MNKTQCFLLVLIIFLGILSFRLYFSLKTNNFASDDAYFGFRQTQYITEHTKAMSFDSLSYGGKPIANTSLFYYILAFFSFLMPIKLALKIIPEIFISSLVIIVISFQKS